MASSPDQELEDLRREVDRLDGAMVELLAERLRVVREIARIKQTAATGRPAIRPGREAVILRRLVEQRRRPLPRRRRWCACGASCWRPPPAPRPRWRSPPACRRIGRSCGTSPATISARWRRSSVPASWSQALRLVADGAGRSRRAAAARRGRALVGGPARHVGPAAAGRGPAAVRPGRPAARRQRRHGRGRDRARAVRRRSQPPGARDAGRGRPRPAARRSGGGRAGAAGAGDGAAPARRAPPCI